MYCACFLSQYGQVFCLLPVVALVLLSARPELVSLLSRQQLGSWSNEIVPQKALFYRTFTRCRLLRQLVTCWSAGYCGWLRALVRAEFCVFRIWRERFFICCQFLLVTCFYCTCATFYGVLVRVCIWLEEPFWPFYNFLLVFTCDIDSFLSTWGSLYIPGTWYRSASEIYKDRFHINIE